MRTGTRKQSVMQTRNTIFTMTMPFCDYPQSDERERATGACLVLIHLKNRVITPGTKIAMTTNTKTIELSEEWDSLACLS
jgi:hypothetical protein